MEAPDKIYVNFPFGEEHPWCGPMVTKQGLNRHDTTYIRKDALLEWAKEQASITEKLNGRGAMLKAWNALIDKIESL